MTLIQLVIFIITFTLLFVIGGKIWPAALGIGSAGGCSAEAVNKDFRDSITDIGVLNFFANTNIYLQNCKPDVQFIKKGKTKLSGNIRGSFLAGQKILYTIFKYW